MSHAGKVIIIALYSISSKTTTTTTSRAEPSEREQRVHGVTKRRRLEMRSHTNRWATVHMKSAHIIVNSITHTNAAQCTNTRYERNYLQSIGRTDAVDGEEVVHHGKWVISPAAVICQTSALGWCRQLTHARCKWWYLIYFGRCAQTARFRSDD